MSRFSLGKVRVSVGAAVALAVGGLLSGCWMGGGENPGATFDLTVDAVEASRNADDSIVVAAAVSCSATEYERVDDPDTASPGRCPLSEWRLITEWYPRSALMPSGVGTRGELRFDVPIDDVRLEGSPEARVEVALLEDEPLMDMDGLSIGLTTPDAIVGADLVIDVVLERRQADVPGDFSVQHRSVLVSP
ncbi:MAG: hypothetical protein AB7S26_39150 [Sandaracinaceae bacterium]